MSRKVHMCIDIEGVLRWPDRRLVGLLKTDRGAPVPIGMTRDYLRACLAEGKRVLPFGDPCTGFSYQTGCPGHEES